MPTCCTIQKPCNKHLTAGLSYASIQDFKPVKISVVIPDNIPDWIPNQFIFYRSDKIPEEDFLKVFKHMAEQGFMLYDGNLIS